MAWSPPACRRRSWLVEQAGDYATLDSNHIRDGTQQQQATERQGAAAYNSSLATYLQARGYSVQ